MREPSTRERLSRFILLCGALGTIALVTIVTQRLSAESLSLALGVALGVAAIIIPLVIVLALVYLVMRWTEARAVDRPRYQSQQPPVLVVNPQAQLPAPQYQVDWSQSQPAYQTPRQFTVIGEE